MFKRRTVLTSISAAKQEDVSEASMVAEVGTLESAAVSQPGVGRLASGVGTALHSMAPVADRILAYPWDHVLALFSYGTRPAADEGRHTDYTRRPLRCDISVCLDLFNLVEGADMPPRDSEG